MQLTTHLTPEHLPGEPAPRPSNALDVLGRLLVVVVSLAVGLPFLPLYLVIRLVRPRPPHRPSLRTFLRIGGWILTDQPPPPGLPARVRLGLLLELVRQWALAPMHGVFWYLDELVYGRALRRVQIVAPLFEISGTRSGSTQLAHYLEADPGIAAPTVLQMLFPYRWLWRLAAATLGKVVSREQVRARMHRKFGEAFLQRHELDPFGTDTFEAIFGLGQLGPLYLRLGPRRFADGLSMLFIEAPPDHELPLDFLRFLDAMARKTLLHAPGRRLMIKGHFLAFGSVLAARHPDARFLAVLRVPEKRIQSAINYFRVQPEVPLCGPPPWAWVVAASLEVETAYHDREHAWFSQGERRTVVRFEDYVRDLEGVMTHIYRECLGADLPAHVPRVHTKRARTGYTIDRSLEQLGVDTAALNARCAAWLAWHASLAPPPGSSSPTG